MEGVNGMTFLMMLSPEGASGDGDNTPSFTDIARLIIAVILIVGAGWMLAQPTSKVSVEALVGLVSLVVGYYFGVATTLRASSRSKGE